MVLYPNKLPESERVCSGICNTVFRILVYEQAHHVAANKSGTAGNQYVTFECSHKIKN